LYKRKILYTATHDFMCLRKKNQITRTISSLHFSGVLTK